MEGNHRTPAGSTGHSSCTHDAKLNITVKNEGGAILDTIIAITLDSWKEQKPVWLG